MRLPPFLRFLQPKYSDGLAIRGHIKVERISSLGTEIVHDGKNFIVDDGISAMRDVLIGGNGGGFAGSIFRMAIGDGGTPVGNLYTPKPVDPLWPARTSLFHEILRKDIDTFSRPTDASMRFVCSFNSVDVDNSSYSLAERVINEACLVIGDGVLTGGGDKKQVNKTPPDTLDGDERMVSMRTFKSASFDSAETITITVTWTLTIAKS